MNCAYLKEPWGYWQLPHDSSVEKIHKGSRCRSNYAILSQGKENSGLAIVCNLISYDSQ